MIRFDYDSRGWQFIGHILNENSRRLSRTRSGVSDTAVSPLKEPLLLAGEVLRRRSQENEERVQQFIYQTRHDLPPATAGEVLALLWALADLTNDGLLPSPKKLRTWALSAYRSGGPKVVAEIPPVEVEAGLERFAETVAQGVGGLRVDPVPLAAWAEWELNGGPLHPFYDGCGRISRSFGALLLVRGSCLLPLYGDREAYFRHGQQSHAAFTDYVRSSIDRCRQWLESVATD